MSQYHGHLTLEDGTHVPLTKEEAEAIWAKAKAEHDALKQAIPDERSALRAMMDGYVRLKEMGWNDIIYCPKDGSWFDSISAGSTGIHPCKYEGKWPNGSWWIADGGDIWPGRPILWRPSPTKSA